MNLVALRALAAVARPTVEQCCQAHDALGPLLDEVERLRNVIYESTLQHPSTIDVPIEVKP